MKKGKKFEFILGVIVLFVLFVLPLTGMSAVLNVSTPAGFQDALNTAVSNNQADTINVAAGTYNLTSTLLYDHTSMVYDNNPLTIVGTAGAATTILNGDTIPEAAYYKHVMMIDCTAGPYGTAPDANCDISISGLTFQNGTEYNGAGLYFNSFESDLVIENCVFFNNEAESDTGGGLYAYTRANVTLRNNIFNYNTAEYSGAGAYVNAGGYYGGTALIESNNFTGNFSYNEDGGGAYIYADYVTITGNTLNNNTLDSGYYGGAGLYAEAKESAILSNNTFTNNNSSYDGPGGAFVYSSGSVTVTDNQFSDNIGYDGGGLEIDFYATLTLSNNVFTNNSSKEGGGAYIAAYSTGTPKIINNVFTNNTATYYNGGGLYLGTNTSTPAAVLTNNTFTRNTVSGPGGEYYGKGGGMYIRTFHNDTGIALHNNIVWGNSAVEEGDDIYIRDDTEGDGTGSTINLYNNDYSDFFITDGDHLFQGSNINSNPNFVNALNNDVHLLGYSPCIEAGNDSAPELPATDYEGDTRIINDHVDIGADEYNGVPITFSLTMEVNPSGAGTTTPSVGTTSVSPGVAQAISASPNGNYLFVNWSTSGNEAVVANVNSASTTVTLTDDASVTAYFCLIQTWYLDGDDDDYGNPAGPILAQCSQPDGYVTDNTDCDDADVSVHPGATEACDGIDNNCDGNTDEGVTTSWYLDSDGDGFGDPDDSVSTCNQPEGYVADNSDNCPDTDSDNLSDSDDDTVGDVCDNCPADYNPDQADADTPEDGVGNVCDTGDADGDGFSDREEILCDSDPADIDSRCGAGLSFLMLLLGD